MLDYNQIVEILWIRLGCVNLKYLKRVIVAAVVIAIASQINIGIMNTDFRVSAGIILFAILLFQYEDLKPVPMGLISGIIVYILRCLIYFFVKGSLKEVMFSYQLEILFYTFYGIIYSLLVKRSNKINLNMLLLILITCDMFANLVEISSRIVIEASRFHLDIILTLLLVAVVRSGIVWLVLNWIKYYKVLLLKEEHEIRYTRLLWLTAQLKSEMYWMEKNMDNIENVMSNSYVLFEKINGGEDKNSYADRALAIARDVHEIKKEYKLAIRGIKELTEDKLRDDGMNFKDIITILYETMKREVRRIDKNIELLFDVGENFYTSKHYFLMSIFRNLIMNSIDAIPDSKRENRISFSHKIEKEQHVFIISDTGCGIDEENLEHIFSPGFSTKINYTTGQINRGLGLSVVLNIVERELKGRVAVSSKKDNGTTFEIYIPRNSLEVI